MTHKENAPTPLATLPQESVRRILVCQLRQIGDVLLATPSIELLARRYPKAELHVFTEKKCLPMLQGNPHIHTIWAVDKKAMPTLLHELAFYRKVTAKGFDLVVDFQQLPRCRWVVAFSGAKVKLTEDPPWYTRWLYTHWARPTPAYSAAFKAQVLTPLGICWQGERPRLYLSGAEKEEGCSLLAEFGIFPEQGQGGVPGARNVPDAPGVSGAPGEQRISGACDAPGPQYVAASPLPPRLITVDATHRHRTRQWPAAHYAALMDAISAARPEVRFLLPWGPGAEEHVRSILAASSLPGTIIVPEKLLSLRQMAACMSHAAMHLGNCSAPRHMAVALDVPTFTILGSTSTGWTFPSPEHTHIRAADCMDMPCQACNKNSCTLGDYRCLNNLTPELVLPAALAHLDRFGR